MRISTNCCLFRRGTVPAQIRLSSIKSCQSASHRRWHRYCYGEPGVSLCRIRKSESSAEISSAGQCRRRIFAECQSVCCREAARCSKPVVPGDLPNSHRRRIGVQQRSTHLVQPARSQVVAGADPKKRIATCPQFPFRHGDDGAQFPNIWDLAGEGRQDLLKSGHDPCMVPTRFWPVVCRYGR